MTSLILTRRTVLTWLGAALTASAGRPRKPRPRVGFGTAPFGTAPFGR